MSNVIRSSITDIPRNVAKGQKDNFGIEPFEKGLIKFIDTTSTPITIALQGEWGSGKTSLMNSLNQYLSVESSGNFHSVWLNTWEYALMKDTQSTLIDIISKLIDKVTEIANIGNERKNKLIKGVQKIGFSALKIASSMNSITKEVFDEAQSHLSVENSVTVGEIRDELEKIIADCIAKDNKQGFIFFIDDLDRIDPPVAVELLELLKNLFTLKNCVFILAIDYDVVVKGLEPKFGRLTETNEREFRSFFDKIIQVPFSMPVASYKADVFLQESLKSISYLSEKQANNNDLISKFSEISGLTVGSNPRALKRLLNSISLISCINSAKNQSEEDNTLNSDFELLINFALVSIQIAYPPVYRLLTAHPDFVNWDESVALKYNLKQLSTENIEKLNTLEEFDDDWEKILFRLCENDYYLKKKSLNISRLLNNLKVYISHEKESIEDIILSIISLSSVTNIETETIALNEIEYHRGHFLKHLRNLLIPKLKEKLPHIAQFIGNKGKRVQSNAFIKFSENEVFEWLKLHSHPYEGKVRLIMNYDRWICAINNHNHPIESMAERGQDFKDELLRIEQGYNCFSDNFNGIEQSQFFDHISKRDGCFCIDIYSYLVQPVIDDFYKEETLELLSNVIAQKYNTIKAMSDLHQRFWNK